MYQVSGKQTVRFGKISKNDSEALALSEGLTNGSKKGNPPVGAQARMTLIKRMKKDKKIR